jgi:hypothetical protein
MPMTAKPRYYRARPVSRKRAEPPAPAPIDTASRYRTLIDLNFSPETAAGLCADRWL